MKPDHLFKMSHNVENRGHRFKLFKKPLNKGLYLRKYIFLQRVLDTWNGLSDSVVKVTAQFKIKIHDCSEKHGYGTAYNLFYTHQSQV